MNIDSICVTGIKVMAKNKWDIKEIKLWNKYCTNPEPCKGGGEILEITSGRQKKVKKLCPSTAANN
jgi:hypothetical protein